jgi:hypothetical protein
MQCNPSSNLPIWRPVAGNLAVEEFLAERRNEYALELGTGIYEEEREP